MSVTIRRFHWDDIDDCVMHETDETGETLVSYTHEPGAFGPLLSEYRDGTEYYHLYDALGSTTMLTDDSGTVTDTFAFDAWGIQVTRTGATDTVHRWNGRWGYEFDVASCEYFVRMRVYQPTVGRWRSIDSNAPIVAIVGYIYSDNRIVVLIDPTGNSAIPAQGREQTPPPDVIQLSQSNGSYSQSHCPGAPTFLWTTKWKIAGPGADHVDGYVIQRVSFSGDGAFPCTGESLTSDEFPNCKNKTECNGYAELWEVKNGEIEGGTDSFGIAGYKELTYGKATITGSAVFIPSSSLTQADKTWLDTNMTSGPKGATNACSLRSKCNVGDDADFVRIFEYGSKTWKGKAILKPTTKTVLREWNCCVCPPLDDKLVRSKDGKKLK